jgi:hypothetical protein
MNREQIIDIIRRELIRQANLQKLTFGPGDKPDEIVIHGMVDLYAIAEAIKNN